MIGKKYLAKTPIYTIIFRIFQVNRRTCFWHDGFCVRYFEVRRVTECPDRRLAEPSLARPCTAAGPFRFRDLPRVGVARI